LSVPGLSVLGMEEEGQQRWTADQVLALAPDASSRKDGAKLAASVPWSGTGTTGPAVWGLCAGSGSNPYRTVIDTAGPGYKCSCPSRKFPCKHALGLLLLWSGGAVGSATPDSPPDWVADWLDARRSRELATQDRPATGAVADPAAARQRAERRAQRVAAGAAELDQRLADLLRGGLAGAEREGYQRWDEVAARMVDAQAPGLAARVRELGGIAGAGGDWPSTLLEEASLLHLLTQGYARQDRLPAPLAATVRTRIGFTSAPGTPGVRDRWLVLAQHDSSDDRLTTRRIWLHGEATARAALLLSFGAAGRAPELALPVGLSFDADLAFHPAASPLRAALGTAYGTPAPSPVPPGTAVGPALASYGDALAHDPWLDAWPVVLSGVVPIPAPTGWQLADTDGSAALPVIPRAPAALWRLASVAGGHPLTVFGELGHRGFHPLTAWGEDAVPVAL
jgi:hypothetical protein